MESYTREDLIDLEDRLLQPRAGATLSSSLIAKGDDTKQLLVSDPSSKDKHGEAMQWIDFEVVKR